MLAKLQRIGRRFYQYATLSACGRIRYFGSAIYAPRESEIARRIMREVIYEPDTLAAIKALVKPKSFVLDVGANIGSIAVPLLAMNKDLEVLSVECSPSTLPYLRRTMETSSHLNRWHLDERAVWTDAGAVLFHTAGPNMGAYDGILDTGRGGNTREVKVQTAPLDQIWQDHNCPPISVIKIDIEGAEFEAILSAQKLIEAYKPAIIFEWNATNLKAYNRNPLSIFELEERVCGRVYALPTMQRPDTSILPLQMSQTETFVLFPAGS